MIVHINREPKVTMGGEHTGQESWRDYQKHVLGALDRMDKQLDVTRSELRSVNIDMAKFSVIHSTLTELDNKLSSLKREMSSQEGEFKDAIESLENDDKSNMKKVEEQLAALNKKIDDLNEFMSRAKTIAWMIGVIIGTIVGMFSLSLKDFIK